MGKLGISAVRASQGFRELYTKNCQTAADERETISKLSIPVGQFIYLISYVPEGTTIRIIAQIIGRGGDFLAASLFIPKFTHVDTVTLSSMVENIKGAISDCINGSGVLNTQVFDMIAAAEFPDTAPAYPVYKGADNAIAYRIFGAGCPEASFSNILEASYQKIYSQFKSVIFVENGTGIGVLPTAKFTNITSEPFARPTILPGIKLTAPDPQVSIFVNGEKYADRPMVVSAPVTITVRKEGYVTKEYSLQRVEGAIQIPEIEWNKEIRKSLFRVSCAGNPVAEYKVMVNGRSLTTALSVSKEEASNADVVVEAAGYKTWRKTVNIWNPATPVSVVLEPNGTNYSILGSNVSFSLPVRPGSDKSISPIYGYKVLNPNGMSINLAFNKGAYIKKMVFIIAIAVALLLGIAIGGAAGYFLADGSKEAKVENVGHDDDKVKNLDKNKDLDKENGTDQSNDKDEADDTDSSKSATVADQSKTNQPNVPAPGADAAKKPADNNPAGPSETKTVKTNGPAAENNASQNKNNTANGKSVNNSIGNMDADYE